VFSVDRVFATSNDGWGDTVPQVGRAFVHEGEREKVASQSAVTERRHPLRLSRKRNFASLAFLLLTSSEFWRSVPICLAPTFLSSMTA
jgi:hypothetical protein